MSIAAISLNRLWSVRAETGGAWHLWVRAASLAAATAAFGVALWLGSYASVLVGALALTLGWGVVALVWRGPERDFAITIYLGSMGLRLLAGVLGQIALARTDGFMFEDDRAYDEIAWRVVEVWRGDREGIHRSDNYLLVNYTYELASLYNVIGHELLAAKWLNALVSSMASVMTFALALRFASTAGARLAGLAMTLFPSLIFWAALNLKDSWVVLLIPTVIYGMMKFSDLATNIRGPFCRRDALAIGVGVATLFAFNLLENLRIYVYGALGWLFIVSYPFLVWKNQAEYPRKLAYGVSLAFILMALMATSDTRMGGLGFLTVKQADALVSNRVLISEKAETGLELAKPPKGTNPWMYQLEHLPIGVVHVLGAPAPWALRRVKDLPLIPEMTAWYAMLALAAMGLITAVKLEWRRMLFPLLFTGAIIGVLGLVEGNVGTIFRHRAMLMPTTFTASAIGFTWLLRKWRETQLVRAPVRVAT